MMLLSTRRESGPCRPPPSHSLRSGVQQRLVRRDLDLDQVRLGRLRLRQRDRQHAEVVGRLDLVGIDRGRQPERPFEGAIGPLIAMHLLDRKSTRLNSSHMSISYAVFCLKKKSMTHSAVPVTS